MYEINELASELIKLQDDISELIKKISQETDLDLVDSLLVEFSKKRDDFSDKLNFFLRRDDVSQIDSKLADELKNAIMSNISIAQIVKDDIELSLSSIKKADKCVKAYRTNRDFN
jgi:uncharacterized protein YjgD (DUF1641 family)